MDYFDIARRSSARGRQTRVGWGKRAIFELIRQSKSLLMTNRKLHALSIRTKIDDLG